jgi:hypothetical protein
LHVGELPWVRNHLESQRDKCFATFPVYAAVFSDDFKQPIPQSSSLDKITTHVVNLKKTATAAGDAQKRKEQAGPAETKGSIVAGGTKIISFSDSKDSSTSAPFSFKREPITPAAGASGLQGIRSNLISVKIFRGEGKCVVLKVPPDANVARVIEEYRRKEEPATSESPSSSQSSSVSLTPRREPAYSLLIAEDDGSIDSDFDEVLQPHQIVKNFGSTFFLKVETGHGAKSVIRVHLPNSEYQTVEFVPGMQGKDLLARVCKRAFLDASEHFLHLHSATSEGPISLHVSLDTLIKNDPKIVKSGISVRRKEKEGQHLHEPKSFWSDAEAFIFKQYTVNKILSSKFGIGKERVLGIYHDTITSSVPLRSGASMKTNYSYPLRNLEVAELIGPTKPAQFRLQFKDNKSYLYEAKTVEDACEIVGKIKYCANKGRK